MMIYMMMMDIDGREASPPLSYSSFDDSKFLISHNSVPVEKYHNMVP